MEQDLRSLPKDVPGIQVKDGNLELDASKFPPLEELIRKDSGAVSVRGNEDSFLHILQPMEEAIFHESRERRSLKNKDIRRALKEVLRQFPQRPFSPLAERIFDAVHTTAALNAGRISDREIIGCLNRILNSIKFHSQGAGYLHFLNRMFSRALKGD